MSYMYYNSSTSYMNIMDSEGNKNATTGSSMTTGKMTQTKTGDNQMIIKSSVAGTYYYMISYSSATIAHKNANETITTVRMYQDSTIPVLFVAD